MVAHCILWTQNDLRERSEAENAISDYNTMYMDIDI